MSIKSKLLDKTGDLLAAPSSPVAGPGGAESGADGSAAPASAAPSPARPSAPMFPGVVPGAGARTAPGQMMQFRSELQAKEQEVERLRQELDGHRDSVPTRLLDPQAVTETPWANRHDATFRSAAFESLKRDILASGGNIQPIRVRPVDGVEGARYEVVFGHRRLRACRELGLPVLAMVDSEVKDDVTLFALMDRENRERADLSPYEQGQAYKRALDAGLFPSRRRLAEALEVSHTWVSNVLAVAELPQAIVECFQSPLEVQHRHAKVIGEALARDNRGVLRRAEKLRQLPNQLSASAVVANLLGSSVKASAMTALPLRVGGQVLGKLTRKPNGALSVELLPGAAAAAVRDQLLKALSASLDEATQQGAQG